MQPHKSINNTLYAAVPAQTPCLCTGCAAYGDGEETYNGQLCRELGSECATGDLIWIEVKDFRKGMNGTTAADIPKAKDQITNPIKDSINPDHYKVGGIETIEYLKAKLTPEEFKGYLKGNALKYLSRSNYKHDNPMEDFKKALWYVDKLVETLDT